ncbi:vWA domain-containing protein [Nocardia inohanensis]|uniref:vWA domain-containing protein n=1 Tax=Nocardia inohanensis TaxID=209246 RepID=UPI000833EDCA|nr:vWA domain-containing protein [Nocardia inohanensis]
MNTARLLDHLRTHDTALTLSRAGVVKWDDAEFHREAYTADPEGYALLALVPGVRETQRARALLQVLAASRAGLDADTRKHLDKATRALLFGVRPDLVITVLLALRRMRANHKHVTRAILAFVLEHPDAELLIPARRPSLVDCFEHALGKATARGCARLIAEGDAGSAELRRKLLRYTANPAVAIERVRELYAPGMHGVPTLTEPVAPIEPRRVREPIVTVSNRGDIAATLVRVYRGSESAESGSALAGYVTAAARDLPRNPDHVALVLDTSESMRGYGEREWALLSQAEALRLVLAEVCERLTVIEVGHGQTAATDLANGLLDAIEAGAGTSDAGADFATGAVRHIAPDVVVIVTDGYENRMPGDLARVTAALRRIGITTPVLLAQAMFTSGDDLALRNPAPNLPRQGFWHQDDFGELLPWMFAHGPSGAEWIRAAALRFLDARLEGVNA